MDSLITKFRDEIVKYKNDVIGEKYSNNVAVFREVLDKLNKEFEEFRKSHGDFSSEDIYSFNEANKDNLYFATEMFNEIEQFSSLDMNDAEVLELQNRYFKNLVIYDETLLRLDAIFRDSDAKMESFIKVYHFTKDDERWNEYFVNVQTTTGERKISKDYATEFEKMDKLRQDLQLVLAKDRVHLENLRDQKVNDLPAISLGEVEKRAHTFKFILLPDEEIKNKMDSVLEEIQSLQNLSGAKKKYQFSVDGKLHEVIIPISQKPSFEKMLDDLGNCQIALEVHKNNKKKPKKDEIVKPEYVPINIDHNLLQTMTSQQIISHLQTIMLRIEGYLSTVSPEKMDIYNPVEVEDLNGNNKKIPVYYYNVYQECIDLSCRYSFQVDQKYVDQLDDQRKITYYELLLNRIENSPLKPFAIIEGKNIPAKFAQNYIEVKDTLEQLKEKVRQSTPLMLEDFSLREYQIDEAHVETLSDDEKLKYYSNLIWSISQSDIEPKKLYEIFGQRMNIPVSLVETVKNCVRNMQPYMTKRECVIRESEVRNRTPEMQFVYYGNLIEKMKHSSKEPKVDVILFGETISIPKEYLYTCEECIKRMTELKESFGLTSNKKHAVKNVRKPVTTRVKDWLKNKANRVKVALGAAGAVILSGAVAMFSGPYFGPGMPTVKADKGSIESTVDLDVQLANATNAQAAPTVQPMNQTDKQIEEMVNTAKQSMSSQFGSTFIPTNSNVYTNAVDHTPKKLDDEFLGEVYTITKTIVEIPGMGIQEFSFRTPQAQAYVNDLMNQGGKVVRVAGVAEKAETHYMTYQNETGYFDINDINMVDYANRSKTNLSQQVLAQINQERGVSR